MRARTLQHGRRDARARFAMAVLVIVGLAGCASGPMPAPGGDLNAPYVGLFTGELVDGKPVYRFPAIEVLGWRSRVVDD